MFLFNFLDLAPLISTVVLILVLHYKGKPLGYSKVEILRSIYQYWHSSKLRMIGALILLNTWFLDRIMIENLNSEMMEVQMSKSLTLLELTNFNRLEFESYVLERMSIEDSTHKEMTNAYTRKLAGSILNYAILLQKDANFLHDTTLRNYNRTIDQISNPKTNIKEITDYYNRLATEVSRVSIEFNRAREERINNLNNKSKIASIFSYIFYLTGGLLTFLGGISKKKER